MKFTYLGLYMYMFLTAAVSMPLPKPSSAAAEPTAAEEDGFVSLFNGQSLVGWDGDPRFWSVVDGVIRGQTTEENPADHNTFLVWRGGQVKDFELKIQFRIEGGNNSGIQYRSREFDRWRIAGYQAEIINKPDVVGFLWNEQGKRKGVQVGQSVVYRPGNERVIVGQVADRKVLRESGHYLPGAWNECHIIARGNHVIHRINGRKTVEFVDKDPEKAALKGLLALQLHGGNPMLVEFKDIRLKQCTSFFSDDQMLSATGSGDRQPRYNCVLPDDVFLHNGGRVIDVTQPPFNADPERSKPGREHDDTAALVAAYDFVVDKVRTHGYDNAGSQWIIYLPDGVYDVSDSIVYTVDPPLLYQRYGMIYLRIWGQSREGTIIRLKDNSPGFEAGSNKVVLSYHKHKGTNAETVNSLENLTIDTGSGNPGAIGVQYVAANEGCVRNLEIRSGDGLGSVGLYFPLFSVQGTFHDITIDGFDYGIRAVHEHEVNPCLEHLTLRNQRKAGIDVTDGTVFIRNLASENKCPAVRQDGHVGQVVLIDSRLASGAADQPAIAMVGSGAMFVRNVHIDGYASAIHRDNQPIIDAMYVDQWVSHPINTLFANQEKRSLNLPIRDAPQIPWFNPATDWVSPEFFGAKADGVTDDSSAVQAAFNAGQPCVYFPGQDYVLEQPIRVPAHVQRIEFLFSWVRRGRFMIDAASEHPVLFQNSGNLVGKPDRGATIQFVSRQPRTVVVNLATGNYRNELKSPAPVDVFLENMVLYAGEQLCPRLTRLWGRSLDTEHKGSAPMYDCRGGTLWLASTKTEQSGTPYGVRDGGRLEALGGYTNATEASENYMVEVHNASASVVTCQTFGGKWPNIIREKRDDEERTATSEQFPKRPGWNGVYIPLYVGRGEEVSPVIDGH